jgi:hypothetical protein
MDSWTGDCSGSTLSTTVLMNGVKACTANFAGCPDNPAKNQQTGAIFTTLGNAYNDVTTWTGDTIMLLGTTLAGGGPK